MIIQEGRLTIRWYGPADLERLTDLLSACFPDETWTPEALDDFRAKRHNGRNKRFPKGATNAVKILTDNGDEIYGAMLYTMWDGPKSACVVRRLAVWPDYRRRGLGRFLLNHVIGKRAPVRVPIVIARVHERHAEAQMLLKNAGFLFDPHEEREIADDRGEYYMFRRPR